MNRFCSTDTNELFLPGRPAFSGSGRITAIRKLPCSLGEFETCPDWVAVMDTGQQFVRITLKTMGDHGFDQRADPVAKVRNVSNVGSQVDPMIASSLAPLIEETDW